jgi:hypothetical protein
MMRAVAVGHGRHQYGLPRNPCDGTFADPGAQYDVGVHREVRAMILVGRHGQHGDAACP